ncbi:unnamed protein product [Amoebophrya sp. A120]|nr:unnamed protein product [Amoebophrya sp. A120]|eukprot:GSA120T00000011001.1
MSHAVEASQRPRKICHARACITDITSLPKYATQTWQASRPRHFSI